ncbi:MAG: hypothetical protein M0021_05430 [Clostridia bacterium]|nr:hypothetical protein [Clostridia bacterium]
MSDQVELSHSSNFEIDCLRVEKVFDACSTRLCLNFDFDPTEAVKTGESGTVPFEEIERIISCEGLDGAEVFGTITSRPGTPIADVQAIIKGHVRITVRTKLGGTIELIRRVKFHTRVLLFAPRPRSMFVCGEALIRCLGCVLHPIPGGGVIRCAVGTFVIIKTCGTVELRVPTLGVCPVPDECTVLADGNACEIFLDRQLTHFPPARDFFPPQERL